jgi:hypothetical protein
MLASPTKPKSPTPMLDHPADELLQGVFEPPSGFVLEALAHGKRIVALLTLLGVVAGVGLGVARHTTYTAAATLQVGQVNPNSPGFYSYVSSAAALATAFSHSIDAEPVLDSITKQTGLAAGQAAARLTAEPLPLSPAFRVFATGPSAQSAIKLANVTATAVSGYEGQANSSNPEAHVLLGEYRAASLQLHRSAANLTGLEQQSRHGGSHAPSPDAVASAKAERDTAAARVGAIDDAYTAAVTSQAPRSGLVTLLAGASTASGNRRAKIELPGIVGLLGGILLGCVAAVLLAYRRREGSAVKEPGKHPPTPA